MNLYKKKRDLVKIKRKLLFSAIIFLIIIILNSIISITINTPEEKIIKMQEIDMKLSENINNSDGVTYYISATGTSIDGTDINNPMSLETANSKTYNINDKILLKRGDVFYGQLCFIVSQNGEGMCYVGSYGEGELPKVRGCKILDNDMAWILEDETNNIYSINLTNISNFSGITTTDANSCNIGFLEDNNGIKYANVKESIEELSNEYDFFCDNTKLYIKCSDIPTKKLGTLLATTRIDLCKASSNMIIADIQFEYTGAHAIVKRMYPIENVYIHDCIVENIGGSVQQQDPFTRYGNGIEFWNDAENILIENNIIRNVFDSAITLQGNEGKWENVEIKNNYIISSCYSFEIWGLGKAEGMNNINIYNNIIINQGRCWGQETRTNPQVSANIVIYGYIADYGDINIFDNILYNPKRLFFIPYYVDKDAIIDYYHIYNNKIYYSNDTYYVNNDLEKDLNYYNLENNTNFTLLTNSEIEKICNEGILNSYNYEKINSYYQEIEKQIQYENAINIIIEQYDEFENKYETLISNNYNIKDKIQQLKYDLKNVESITIENILNNITDLYILGTNMINQYNDNQINLKTQDIENVLSDLDEIGDSYQAIINIMQNEIKYEEISDLYSVISKVQTKISYNIDLNIDDEIKWIEKANDNIQKNIFEDNKINKYVFIKIKYLLDWTDKLTQIYINEYIEANPVIVSYTNSTDWTNDDVVATLNIGNDATVTNNGGSNIYTFRSNGSFTFEYERRGQAFTLEAKVSNIDKTYPTITGVKDGQTYTSSVKPVIEDTNLSIVSISYNGEDIEYYDGITLEDEGMYSIVATDRAGNTTTVEFNIISEVQDNYIIQDNYLLNVWQETTLTDFKNNYNSQESYIIKRNDTELTDADVIATGDTLEFSSGDTYTIVVAGDINCDGKVSVFDLSILRRYILRLQNLTGVQAIAADINVDGKELTVLDYSRMRIEILGIH